MWATVALQVLLNGYFQNPSPLTKLAGSHWNCRPRISGDHSCPALLWWGREGRSRRRNNENLVIQGSGSCWYTRNVMGLNPFASLISGWQLCRFIWKINFYVLNIQVILIVKKDFYWRYRRFLVLMVLKKTLKTCVHWFCEATSQFEALRNLIGRILHTVYYNKAKTCRAPKQLSFKAVIHI